MEYRNCEEYVLAELQRVTAELEELTERHNTTLKHYSELYTERNKIEAELERAIEQMTELESQMQIFADKYNELERNTTITVSSFEPVREVGDGAE
jgi:chromosome segregation ATPase